MKKIYVITAFLAVGLAQAADNSFDTAWMAGEGAFGDHPLTLRADFDKYVSGLSEADRQEQEELNQMFDTDVQLKDKYHLPKGFLESAVEGQENSEGNITVTILPTPPTWEEFAAKEGVKKATHVPKPQTLQQLARKGARRIKQPVKLEEAIRPGVSKGIGSNIGFKFAHEATGKTGPQRARAKREIKKRAITGPRKTIKKR